MMKLGVGELTLAWPMLTDVWQQQHYRMLWFSVWQHAWLIIAGLSCYAVSMGCWIFALKQLPLSIAYPLLSLSYVLVYLGAVYLPGLQESVSVIKNIGILCILAGLALVLYQQKS